MPIWRRGRCESGAADLQFGQQCRKLGEALKALPGSLRIVDDGSLTIHEITARSRAFAARHSTMGVVVIDYLQKVTAGDRYVGDRVLEVAEISGGAKALGAIGFGFGRTAADGFRNGALIRNDPTASARSSFSPKLSWNGRSLKCHQSENHHRTRSSCRSLVWWAPPDNARDSLQASQGFWRGKAFNG